MSQDAESIREQIDRLQAELKLAQAREADERRARRDAVPIRMAFALEPGGQTYSRIYDHACRLYRLEGRVTNRAEAEEAGHSLDRREGGMTYVFNSLSGKLVMAIGGGTIFVGGFTGDPVGDADVRAFDELSKFLVDNPDGGDVTAIVASYRAEKGR